MALEPFVPGPCPINFISNIQGKIIGADIVEYNPYKDINEITAITAGKLLKELMGKIIE